MCVDEQFLQVQQIGFVTLGPLRYAYSIQFNLFPDRIS